MASTWDTNTYDWTKSAGNIFGSSGAPSFNTGTFGGWSGGASPNFSVDWDNTLDLPGLAGSGALRTPGILSGTDWSGRVPSYSRSSDFDVNKAFEAVGKSLSRLGESRGLAGTNINRTARANVAGSKLVGQGRGYRMYQSDPEVREETEVVQRNKSGIGGAIGTIAGIGASLIPGVGAGIAPFLPTIGGTVGGLFG